MLRQQKYSICQLLVLNNMHVQKKKNRSFPDITSLRNQQSHQCHTESHHFSRQGMII